RRGQARRKARAGDDSRGIASPADRLVLDLVRDDPADDDRERRHRNQRDDGDREHEALAPAIAKRRAVGHCPLGHARTIRPWAAPWQGRRLELQAGWVWLPALP